MTNSGILEASDGGLLILEGTWINSGTLEANGGTISVSSDFDNSGTVNLASGTLTVSGDYTQESNGALDIGIGGTTAGSQFGQLNVSGQASLDGALNLGLLNGYMPAIGDSYEIMNFGSVTGSFAVETGVYIGSFEGFDPTYGSSGLDLIVASMDFEHHDDRHVGGESIRLWTIGYIHSHHHPSQLHVVDTVRHRHLLRWLDRTGPGKP